MIPHSRPTLGTEEKEALLAVLDSGQIAQGERVIEFEKAFCELTGRRYAIAVSSGTSALYLALLALEVSGGDEVILPSYTCAALLHAIDAVGALPVLVDIDLSDFNLAVHEVKKKIRRKTRAVIVPHAFGRAARMEELADLVVPLIEDGTQALGARVGRKMVGGVGELSVFSFYATKMITTGEGGMVLTNSLRLAERLHDLRDYDRKETHRFRTNSKMTDLEAAMGFVQMKKLSGFVARRRELASRYREALKNLEVILPQEEKARDHVYYRFVIRVPKGKKEFMSALIARGIEVKEPVFKPLHQYLDLADSKFPFTIQAVKESCSLPLYPSLSDEACDRISEAIREMRPTPDHVEVS